MIMLQETVEQITDSIRKQMISRSARVTNELRNAELEVLRGSRGGRVYKKPHSKAYYTASAPGEAPAVRSGDLRRNWSMLTTVSGSTVTSEIKSEQYYAGYLQHGTSKMAARPFEERIAEKATPKATAIYSEPYV